MFGTENEVPVDVPEGDNDNEQQEWQAVENLAGAVDVGNVTINGEAVEITLAQMITPALETTFAILAPNWEVSSDECAALGKAWGDVAQVWLPDMQLSPKWAVLGTAIVTTGLVVMPRLKTPPRIEEKQEKEVEQ